MTQRSITDVPSTCTGTTIPRPGALFITIVTQGRLCRFGEIVEGEMQLNTVGQMVEKWWLELERKYPSVVQGAHVVMPNHFHGIAIIANISFGMKMNTTKSINISVPIQSIGLLIMKILNGRMEYRNPPCWMRIIP